jgi:hypothetical protein
MMNVEVLTDSLVLALTQTINTIEYNAQTGIPVPVVKVMSPPREEMKKLASCVLNHITAFATVNSTVISNVKTSQLGVAAIGTPIPAIPTPVDGTGVGTVS